MSKCIAVLSRAADAKAITNFVASALPSYEVLSVGIKGNGSSPLGSLRELARLHRERGCSVLNMYAGVSDDENFTADGVNITILLEQCKLPYSGCRADTMCYPLDIVFMMTHYAGVPLSKFTVVRSADACSAAALQHLTFPVHYAACYPLLGVSSGTLPVVRDDAGEDGIAALRASIAEVGPIVVWEADAAADSVPTAVAEVLVIPSHTEEPCIVLSTNGADDARREQLRTWGGHFARYVLCGVGAARLRFGVDAAGEWVVRHVELNPSLPAALPAESALAASVLEGLVKEAGESYPRPNYEVRLYANSLAYHMCAARSISKGEIVFHDEGRSFAVVTRPFVERNWDAELKTTFSEYAWPLDSEGHLYAIWEDDPRRWRPINHSCDPNLVFGAPHSLNVVASRDIAEGEDLTMDYSTFCDGTMKPFTCMCGSERCRGTISAETAPLSAYGPNAWLRHPVPSKAPLV